MIFWVADYIFLDWFARCYPYMNVWLKLIMDEFVYVFDAWRKLSCGIVYVWPRTNSDTIVCMCIWFCYLELEWMIYGGRLIWCDLPTSKIYRGEGTVLVSVHIFVNKINTYRSVFKKCCPRPYRGHKAAFSRPRSQCFTLRTEPYPVNNFFFGKLNEGEISAQPHTSLCIHIWGFIIQCITNKMCMHNEVWGCAEIFPNFWASKIEVREIKESCLTETFPFL